MWFNHDNDPKNNRDRIVDALATRARRYELQIDPELNSDGLQAEIRRRVGYDGFDWLQGIHRAYSGAIRTLAARVLGWFETEPIGPTSREQEQQQTTPVKTPRRYEWKALPELQTLPDYVLEEIKQSNVEDVGKATERRVKLAATAQNKANRMAVNTYLLLAYKTLDKAQDMEQATFTENEIARALNDDEQLSQFTGRAKAENMVGTEYLQVYYRDKEELQRCTQQ